MQKWKSYSAVILLGMLATGVFSQESDLKIGLMKYSGGGDWYSDPTALPNLIAFCNAELNTQLYEDPETVEPGSPEIFNYPFIHLTGHGNIIFSDYEKENLRKYLLSGGFLHIDDNYGMDKYIRPQIKALFPDKSLTEVGFEHPIFHKVFDFPKGLPKIHEHDNKPPQGFAIFHQGRIVLFYTYETDLGDGWEDPAVHNDSYETRLKALKMGANIVGYAFLE
ncbi:MAG: DUF4159 domain-containing protein [Bacteroidota bacterium]|nr:DUF4159 domain-containing protein [Bacteroidota bacterium]